jgi:hypothetical protein
MCTKLMAPLIKLIIVSQTAGMLHTTKAGVATATVEANTATARAIPNTPLDCENE